MCLVMLQENVMISNVMKVVRSDMHRKNYIMCSAVACSLHGMTLPLSTVCGVPNLMVCVYLT